MFGLVALLYATTANVDYPAASFDASRNWLIMTKWTGGGLAPFGLANVAAVLAVSCVIALLGFRSTLAPLAPQELTT